MPPQDNIDDKIQNLIAFINQSPFYQHLNMKLVEFTEKGCKMEMVVGDEHGNAQGVAHGGSIASLADSACGLALVTAIEGDERIATQNLVVNYLRPVNKGVKFMTIFRTYNCSDERGLLNFRMISNFR